MRLIPILAVLIFSVCDGYQSGSSSHRELVVRHKKRVKRIRGAAAVGGGSERSEKSGSYVYEPTVPVAINGGDPWVGWRVTPEELEKLVESATSTVRGKPVMKQFHPRRDWLWRQWDGTIVRSVMLNEVKLNMAWAIAAISVVWHILPRALMVQQSLGGLEATSLDACRSAVVASLKPVENFWALTQTLVAFVLSFFLSQTYSVWREVYGIARKVQGRISDMGLLLATNGERDMTHPSIPYTTRAIVTMETWARYARLFNMLFFASVTRRFAPLATPKGLQALQAQGTITSEELRILMKTTSWHQTIILWLSTLIQSSIQNGSIRGGSTVAYQCSLIIAQLRSHYGQMGDALSGRMNLAYTHLVQIFVDMLCLAAPLALVGPLGACGAIVGTAAVTLFYTGVLALAKMFLDPFDNEDYGGRSGIRLEADTIVQEVNSNTRRWITAVRDIPKAAFDPTTCVLLPHQQLGLPIPVSIDSNDRPHDFVDITPSSNSTNTEKKSTNETLLNTSVISTLAINEAEIFEQDSSNFQYDANFQHTLHLHNTNKTTTASGSDSIPSSDFATSNKQHTAFRSWRDPDDTSTALRAVPLKSASSDDFTDNESLLRNSKLSTFWSFTKRRLRVLSFFNRQRSRSRYNPGDMQQRDNNISTSSGDEIS